MHIKTMENKQREMQITISERKIPLEETSIRLDKTDQIGHVKEKESENTQSEQEKKNLNKRIA